MRTALPRLLTALVFASALAAQRPVQDELGSPSSMPPAGGGPNLVTAQYTLFGDNCGPSCASLNANRGTFRTGTLPNEYAFGHTFTAPTVIVGFQLYTRTNTLPSASMTCALYRASPANPSAPDLLPVATGTMTVGNTVDFYSVLLNQPVTVNANENVWIAQYDSTNILAAGVTAGTTPTLPSYWRRPPGGGTAWATTGIITFPAWRILCAPDLAFFHSARPQLGTTMSLDLQGAPANALGVLFFGASNPNVPTPFCTSLYSAPTVSLPTTTGATGKASFSLAIPNSASLDGVIFFNQWWVLSGATVVGSNGGHAVLGT